MIGYLNPPNLESGLVRPAGAQVPSLNRRRDVRPPYIWRNFLPCVILAGF